MHAFHIRERSAAEGRNARITLALHTTITRGAGSAAQSGVQHRVVALAQPEDGLLDELEVAEPSRGLEQFRPSTQLF